MKASGRAREVWTLVLTLGMVVASCTTQVLTPDLRPPTPNPQPLTSTESDAATKAKVEAIYGQLPLHFEANQGQTDEQVEFLSRGNGYTLFLTATEAVLALRQPSAVSDQQSAVDTQYLRPRTPDSALSPQPSVLTVRMQLLGANPSPQVVGLEELPGKSNYFIGNDPSKWRIDIPHYAKVKYEGLYPGIDLIYYGNQRQLEYDFLIAPGADPKAIQLAFDGLVGARRAVPLRIDDNGDLILPTAGEELRLHKPRIYQEINGVKQPIPGGYVLLSPQSSSLITFHVAAYDTSKPLIIDPVLSYSTYLGGSGALGDFSQAIAVDTSGNAYVTGPTNSTDFPTASPFQPALGGSNDVFVTKLNAAGSALVYSTFLGGSRNDLGNAIAVDASGNAYVTGHTDSTNFPTANPLQPASGGGIDAFVAKVNPTGSALVYSTYLGGSSIDFGKAIAADSSGNAYVTGFTDSTNFPTASPLQPTLGGFRDAFVTKLNPTGSAFVYSTYLGGSKGTGISASFDTGFGIAVDASGNAYVTGSTGSTDFPTANPLQATNAGGSSDAFVTKLNPTGSTLIYSTYLGGSNFESGFGIAVDASGNAYVTGSTGSTDFPTANPLQATNRGGSDAFVTKLNATGSALVYSTYLGGGQAENNSFFFTIPSPITKG